MGPRRNYRIRTSAGRHDRCHTPPSGHASPAIRAEDLTNGICVLLMSAYHEMIPQAKAADAEGRHGARAGSDGKRR